MLARKRPNLASPDLVDTFKLKPITLTQAELVDWKNKFFAEVEEKMPEIGKKDRIKKFITNAHKLFDMIAN